MTYVISDLHGYKIEKIQELFEKAGFSNDDQCYVLGDVIDRGKDSIKLLRWIMQQPNMHFILGNHEVMMLESAEFLEAEEVGGRPSFSSLYSFNLWLSNGGQTTYNDLQACHPKIVQSIINYLRRAPFYKELTVNGRKFSLTHSGLGKFDKNKTIEDYTDNELIWNRPGKNDLYYDDVITVFGHTPTLFYDDKYAGKMLRTRTWIDIDAGAACGYAPMLLRLDDFQEFYID